MNKLNSILFVIISLILIIFDAYKASHTSFTCDESSSYLMFVNAPVMDVISYKIPILNNHILNSLLMKASQAILGLSELSMRLPNILAHILYLIFTFKLFNRYCEKYAVLFFVLLNANPFLLDFFSLARGYGIAIGLMTTSFYFFCRYIESSSSVRKFHFWATLFVCLAALANFALINVVVIFMIMYNFFEFIISQQKISIKNIVNKNYINIIMLIALSAICYEPIRKLVKLKLLTTGGTNGFWKDTVNSLITASAYHSPYENTALLFCKFMIVLFFALFSIRLIAYFFTKPQINLQQKIFLFFGLTLSLVVLFSIIQHAILKTPFLMTRYALFLYPLFGFSFSFLIIDLSNFSIVKKIVPGAMLFISGLFFVHTCYSINTNWYYEWKYDSDTKKVIEELKLLKEKRGSNNINLGATWFFYPTIEFYIKKWDLNWLSMNYDNERKYQDDYFYLANEDFIKIPKTEIQFVHYYKPTNNYLIKYGREPQSKIVVKLNAANGKYLCHDADRKDVIVANRDLALSWETFTLLRFENDKYAIKTHSNAFFSIEVTPKSLLNASAISIKEQEIFDIEHIDSSYVAIKAANGNYLSLDEKSQQIFASGNSIGKNEKFKMIVVK